MEGLELEALWAEVEAKKQAEAKTLEDLLELHPEVLGLELQNEGGRRFVAILKEFDGSERARLLYFDQRGFSGHSTRESPLDALKEAVSEGFVLPAVGMLDTLAAGREWEIGMQISHCIYLHNAGKMSYAEVAEKVRLLRA